VWGEGGVQGGGGSGGGRGGGGGGGWEESPRGLAGWGCLGWREEGGV